MDGRIVQLSVSDGHTMSKLPREQVHLIADEGVEGDAHAGSTVKHRSRVRRDPTQPNLRQVHLLHAELLDELVAGGFAVAPGVLGENLTTRGVALLDLPTGTTLHVGAAAVLEVTGLRDPCVQLDGIQPGLMRAVLDRDAAGELVRKAGVMSVVQVGGDVRVGDPVEVRFPAGARRPLRPV